MTQEEFYGSCLTELQTVYQNLIHQVEQLKKNQEQLTGKSCVEHYKGRIKSADSMAAKLKKHGLPCTAQSALTQNHDAVGIRIICSFTRDVYEVVRMLRAENTVVEEKDYIANPKENGYRSYHMIVCFPCQIGDVRQILAEIQIRTIAMDCWASLEHQLKYKKQLKNQNLIVRELKRCASELASADVMMQTIQELIEQEDTVPSKTDRRQEENI